MAAHLPPDAASPPRHAWLTRLALMVLLAAVCARATMMEIIRDPSEPLPAPVSPGAHEGAVGAPRLPGPAASLGMDLLCCVPALLILARRALDAGYVLRWSLSHAVLGVLALWTAACALRAGDRFAAIVSAANFIAAVAIMWSAFQLARCWLCVRLVAGVTAGILAVYVAAGLDYRLGDLPELRRNFIENRQRILREQGLEPGSFAARQFERKVMAGDVGVFSASPNTYAAALVMMGLTVAGILIQQGAHRRPLAPPAALAVLLPPAAWLLWQTHSRAGMGICLLMCFVLAATAYAGGWLARRRRVVYCAVAAATAAIALGAIAWGSRHGGFPEKSLTFRWYYWTGAARLAASHPLTGVGPGNFGQHYPSVRLPQAAEEVQDPHNFIVKSFAELGIPGGLLCLLWLALLWWELSTPLPRDDDGAGLLRADNAPSAAGPRAAALPAVLAVAAMAVNLVVSTDWAQAESWIILQTIWRVIWCVLVAGAVALTLFTSLRRAEPDALRAPWLARAMLAAVGAFCLHSMLDFAMSETSALCAFALLAGTCLGIRQPPGAARFIGRRGIVAAVGTLSLLWLAGAALLWMPVLQAESAAAEADRATRSGRFARAAHLYESAWRAVPANADYAYRAARALAWQGADAALVRDMIQRAIRGSPNVARYHLFHAAWELAQAAPDVSAVRGAWERALRLDPCGIRLRLDYARALESLGLRGEAAEQYALALALDDKLPADEPRRLPEDQRRSIAARIAELKR